MNRYEYMNKDKKIREQIRIIIERLLYIYELLGGEDNE